MNKPLTLTILAVLGTALNPLDLTLAAGTAPPGFYQQLALAPASNETVAPEAGGQPPTNQELAKAVQNPLAKLISVPLQNNFNFGLGPNHVVQYVGNFQPVIPITLNENWNLITRTILPTINTPSPAPGIRSVFGLGDLNPTGFFSPASSGRLVWGVGPSLTFPTATDPLLGNGQFCAGPGFVAVYKPGPWVLGLLGNNQWSYAGWGNQEVNAFLLQPLVNSQLPAGLVSHDFAHHHGELGNQPRQYVDCSCRRRGGPSSEAGQASGKCAPRRLLQCGYPKGPERRLAAQVRVCLPVSEAQVLGDLVRRNRATRAGKS